MEKAVFAAGCFWGVESAFAELEGVSKTEVGYIGGWTETPNYVGVCTGDTGHAEAVRVEFDPEKIPYEKLLETFWEIHDPTTLNRQGPDIGTQYRSAIFCYTPAQQAAALDAKEELVKSRKFKTPVVTQIIDATDFPFFPAEEYHQKYFLKQGIKHCPIKK